MLDIKFIRENKELVEKNNATRNVKIDLKKLLELDEAVRAKKVELEGLQASRNTGSKTKPSPEQIKAMKEMGETIKSLEQAVDEKEQELKALLIQLPNLNHETTAIGKDESENKLEKMVGKMPQFSFTALEHFAVPGAVSGIDMERGVKTSGSRFYYLKGKLAILERAIIQFAIDTVVKKGFELVLPPIMVKEDAMFGTGFFPADKNEVYSVNPGEDNLYLIGTSEVPLVYFHSDETIDVSQPKKYAAVTPCFRREAGSYGKDTKGLFRVHQFYKVEMVVFADPKDSWKLHEELLGIEEEVLQALGLHYRVVNVCSGDLGFPAAKKYDCEGWFPGQGRYRELTSTSNTTDYQARRSNIKYKNADGKKAFVHSLNGTVVSDRPLLAIIENYQQEDGSIAIPKALQPYTGFDRISA